MFLRVQHIQTFVIKVFTLTKQCTHYCHCIESIYRMHLRTVLHKTFPRQCLSLKCCRLREVCFQFQKRHYFLLENALSWLYPLKKYKDKVSIARKLLSASLQCELIFWVQCYRTECPQSEPPMSFNVSSQWVSCELKFFTRLFFDYSILFVVLCSKTKRIFFTKSPSML